MDDLCRKNLLKERRQKFVSSLLIYKLIIRMLAYNFEENLRISVSRYTLPHRFQ